MSASATETLGSWSPGLEGIMAARTNLSSVDGQAGELVIRGFPVQDLATQASYEEAAYLLWYDHLPNAAQLQAFKRALVDARMAGLPSATLDLLRSAAAQALSPMDALRMAAGTLSLCTPSETGNAEPGRHSANVAVVAILPTIVASYWRLLNQQEPIEARADLDHAANYLYMLSGSKPSAARARALETYLVALIDHALNASTFTARIIISTQSDLISAIAGPLVH